MINYIDTTQTPVFIEEEKSWRQVIYFSFHNQKVETDLFYSYFDHDYEFSPVYLQSGAGVFEPSVEHDDPSVLSELIHHKEFSLFLNKRKEFYDEVEKAVCGEEFTISDLSFQNKSSYGKEFSCMIYFGDVHFSCTGFFVKQVNWSLFELTPRVKHHSLKNIFLGTAFEKNLEQLLLKEINEHA